MNNKGFTIIELLVVVAILGIVTAIGAPMMKDVITGMSVETTSNQFIMDLNLAKSEAVSRRQKVQMVPASADNWNAGWVINEVDKDGKVVEEIRVHSALPEALNLTTSDFNTTKRIEFAATGRAKVTGSFNLKHRNCNSNSAGAVSITINLMGRSSTQEINC